jgi:SSS family solute:Na+ symporter
MIVVFVLVLYLLALLGLGVLSKRAFRGTSQDFFVASRSIGPFLLVMSLFGTTMTAFALVGSTAKAYTHGIGVYGLMASWAGITHSAVFFLVGVKLWSLGRRYGYVTQVQYFRDRFQSERLGTLLFPVLVALVIPYLLIGLLGAGITVEGVTRNAGLFTGPDGASAGVPPWLTSGVISAVVFAYVFAAGVRGAAWANAFQTVVFLVVGIIAFFVIADALGGPAAATAAARPELLARDGLLEPAAFLSYGLIPLSVGMFPHLFQHWLTARSAASFKAPVVLHPLLILLVWLPCVLLGVWASGALDLPPERANAVLGVLVARFTDPWMSGIVTAGILAAIMSSLDSQFMCLGTMFTKDIAVRGEDQGQDDARTLRIARRFVAGVVLFTYLLSLVSDRGIFELGIWCFSGFSGLFPLVVASLYWRRTTEVGAMASIVAAAGTWILLFTQSRGTAGHEALVGGVMPVTWIFLAATVALIVGSLATRPPNAATLARFFPEETA